MAYWYRRARQTRASKRSVGRSGGFETDGRSDAALRHEEGMRGREEAGSLSDAGLRRSGQSDVAEGRTKDAEHATQEADTDISAVGAEADGPARDKKNKKFRGYRPVSEVGGRMQPGYYTMLLVTAFMSVTMALGICVLVLMPVSGGSLSASSIDGLISCLRRSEVQETLLGLEGIIAGLTVTLAALSWVRKSRPDDPRYWRAWLNDVFDDARREEISLAMMMVLAALFGAVAWLYLVGVWPTGGVEEPTYGGFVCGAVLVVVAGLVGFLPYVQVSGESGRLRAYAETLQGLVAFARWWMAVSDEAGDCGDSGESSGTRVREWLPVSIACGLLAAAVVVVVMILSGAGGLQGMVMMIGAFVVNAITGTFAVYSTIPCIPGVIMWKRGARLNMWVVFAVGSLIAFMYNLLLLVVAIVSIRGESVGGLQKIALAVLLAPVPWEIVLAVYLSRGYRIPLLRRVGARTVRNKRASLQRSCRYYFAADSEPDAGINDEDMTVIADILLPRRSVLVLPSGERSCSDSSAGGREGLREEPVARKHGKSKSMPRGSSSRWRQRVDFCEPAGGSDETGSGAGVAGRRMKDRSSKKNPGSGPADFDRSEPQPDARGRVNARDYIEQLFEITLSTACTYRPGPDAP